nr:hypothetical protein [Tanacetum cinerariifolium]
LDRLESREEAPDLLSQAVTSAREVTGGIVVKKGRVQKLGQVVVAAAHSGFNVAQGTDSAASKQDFAGIASDDGDESWSEGWDTEKVYDLVEQMRG